MNKASYKFRTKLEESYLFKSSYQTPKALCEL